MCRQSFEFSTTCKKVSTLFERFEKAFPEVWEIWGDLFLYMNEKNIDHLEEDGWALWLYIDMDFNSHYMAVVLTSEEQFI